MILDSSNQDIYMDLPGTSFFGQSHSPWGQMEKPLWSDEAQRDVVGRGAGCRRAQASLPGQVVDPLPLESSQNCLDEALENPVLLQSPFSFGYSTRSSQAGTIRLRASRISLYGMLLETPSGRDAKSSSGPLALAVVGRG